MTGIALSQSGHVSLVIGDALSQCGHVSSTDVGKGVLAFLVYLYETFSWSNKCQIFCLCLNIKQAMSIRKCSGRPKGHRYIKRAGRCMSPCVKPSYRQKKSPYLCKTPKKNVPSRCSSGTRRSKKSGRCESKSPASSGTIKKNNDKDKFIHWAKSVRPTCSTFSIRQTSGGCYIAAATLVFAQLFLKLTSGDDSIRAFTRLLMSNEEAGAQTCPKVPTSVLRYYAGILAAGDTTTTTARDVPTVSIENIDLTNGGSAAEFLTAMLFHSKVDTVLVRLSLMPPFNASKLAESMAANGSSGDRSVWWKRRSGELQSILSSQDEHSGSVLVYKVALLGGVGAPDAGASSLTHETDKKGLYNLIVNATDFLLKDVHRHLLAVILHVSRSSDNAAHAVSLFPCRTENHTRWTFCNSWGSDCSSYEEGMAELAEADIDQARGLVLVTRQ